MRLRRKNSLQDIYRDYDVLDVELWFLFYFPILESLNTGQPFVSSMCMYTEKKINNNVSQTEITTTTLMGLTVITLIIKIINQQKLLKFVIN